MDPDDLLHSLDSSVGAPGELSYVHEPGLREMRRRLSTPAGTSPPASARPSAAMDAVEAVANALLGPSAVARGARQRAGAPVESFAGFELPSGVTARRAAETLSRGGSLRDAVDAFLPTAQRPSTMPATEPDMRSQSGLIHAMQAFGLAERLADPAQREQMRRTRETAARQAPGMAQLGGLAESIPLLAVPGGQATALRRVGVQALTGAGVGGLRAGLRSEGETAGEVARDVASGALTEGLTSGGLSAAGESAAPLVRGLAGLASSRARAARDAAVQSRLEGTGMWGARAMRAADAMPGGQRALSRDLRRLRIGGGIDQAPGRAGSLMPRPERALEDAATVREQAGDAIGDVVARMDAAAQGAQPAAGTPGFVDLNPVADELEAIAERYQRLPVGGAQVADTLRSELIAPMRADPLVTFSQAHQQRQLLDDMIRSWVAQPNLTTSSGQLRTARGLVSRAMDDATPGLNPELQRQWRRANRDYSVASAVREYGRGAERLSVGGGIGGAAGTAIENAGQGLVGPVLGAPVAREAAQQTRMVWPGMRAVALEQLAPRLQRLGSQGRRWARTLEQASLRGPTATAATHAVMMRRDPAYRRAMMDLEQRQDDAAPDFEDLFERELPADMGVPAGVDGGDLQAAPLDDFGFVADGQEPVANDFGFVEDEEER